MGTDISFSLTIFTVLAPSGAIAFALLALLIIVAKERDEQTRRLEHWLIIPLAICMIGLVASATHLGTPSNALYVLTGWGRSPLSNEVVSALWFLLVAGLYWLGSFSKRLPFVVSRIWLAVIILSAMWLVSMIGVVYNIFTIPTWSNNYVPYILWLMAIFSGPLLAIVTIAFCQRTKTDASPNGFDDAPSKDGRRSPIRYLRFMRIMLGVSFIALITGLGLMTTQNVALFDIHNSLVTANDLVPYYGLAIAAYVTLSAAGMLFLAAPLFTCKLPKRWASTCCMVLVFVGAAIIRFEFYSMHMTIGF